MAETFAGSVQVGINGLLAGGPNLGSGTFNLNYIKNYVLSNGVGVGQANMFWSSTRTLTASATENIDLSGVLTDAYGTTLNFTAIKGIIIKAASGNTNNVLVGGAASNGFINWIADPTDIVVVRPNGLFMTYANDATGFAVTAGTGDILKVANGGGTTSVTYDIILIGCV